MTNVVRHAASCVRDLIVIGGGSGGLAAAKEAARLGAAVTLFDVVKPSPTRHTTWGLGGTCVNVGCIPKKLFHHVGLLKRAIYHEAPAWGWNVENAPRAVNWDTVRDTSQNYIKRLNFMYRTALRSQHVQYLNTEGRLIDPHTVEFVDSKSGEQKRVEAASVILATGTRPFVPSEVSRAALMLLEKTHQLKGREWCITSDDIFSLPHPPGKTLIVGGSYVALELAGFLAALGMPTSLAIRSVPLRGFDRQCVGIVMEELEASGVQVLDETVLEAVGKSRDCTRGLNVVLRHTRLQEIQHDNFDTVLLATGRRPESQLAVANDCARDDQGFFKVDAYDQTTLPHVYAIGDVTGRIQLTPVAIKAGVLLARRLFLQSNSPSKCMSYDNIPTTIFTPSEYGCVGLSQEVAETRYGEENIEVYLREFTQLESSPIDAPGGRCFAKLVCLRNAPHTILGVHFVGPNAAEVVQGFALADPDVLDFSLVGIHPSNAEVFTQLETTRRSGKDYKIMGGCGGGSCG